MYWNRIIINPCVFSILLGVCLGKLEESFSRCETTAEATTCIYSDGRTIVALIFSAYSGKLVECNVQEEDTVLARHLLKEAIVSRAKEGVYNMLEFDVKKLARKCRKYIRDTKRKDKSHLTLEEETMLRRLSLENSISGTEWCRRSPKTTSLKTLGEREKLDMCCKTFHSCPEIIPPFAYRYDFLNAHIWPMVTCSCASEFRKCLQTEGSDEALRFEETLFDNIRLPCFVLDSENVCQQFDPWTNKCQTMTVQKLVKSIHQVAS